MPTFLEDRLLGGAHPQSKSGLLVQLAIVVEIWEHALHGVILEQDFAANIILTSCRLLVRDIVDDDGVNVGVRRRTLDLDFEEGLQPANSDRVFKFSRHWLRELYCFSFIVEFQWP